MLALPAFNGTTRRYILAVIAVFFADAILSRAYPTFTMLTILSPMLVLHGYPWQVITWAFHVLRPAQHGTRATQHLVLRRVT